MALKLEIVILIILIPAFFLLLGYFRRRGQDRRLAILSSAFEHSTDAILLTDLKGVIIDINPAFSELYGYPREKALGRKTNLLRSKYSTDSFYRQMWQTINVKGEWKGEIINRTITGEEIPVWLSITPIIHTGKKIGYMGIELDMREKKELEKRALQSERLAAVGRMSSQVAHEVRNPLSSISLNVELLRDELETLQTKPDSAKTEEAVALLKAIEKEVDRLSELAGDYLKFSRLPRQKREMMDLSELFTSLIVFLSEEARKRRVELLFHKKEATRIFLDPQQIEQALLNLIRNAFEAMPQGGTVEMGIHNEENSVVISVKDNGCGMDAETQHRIFDPFFTTKEKGSGLGLSLVRQVIAEHGGEVWCESFPGGGTTFFMRLPIEERERSSS